MTADAPPAAPTDDEWRALYDAAVAVNKLAPWKWMDETEVFGVRDPADGELGFVSVMGMAGEMFGIGLYLGAKGLYGFWTFEECGEALPPERLLEIPQLQATFGGRDELDSEDAAVVKRLGLKFRGKRAWPLFRSFRPGYTPWPLEAAEARFLTAALRQLCEVAPRLKADPELLEPPEDTIYLVREADGDGVWQDRQIDVPPPPLTPIVLQWDEAALGRLKRLKKGKLRLEADLTMLPIPVPSDEGRSRFPYLLLLADAVGKGVLGQEMFQPVPTLTAMWPGVIAGTLRLLDEAGVRPKSIAISDPRLFGLLQPLAGELDCELTLADELPALDLVKSLALGPLFDE